jgi:hypothetical protein
MIDLRGECALLHFSTQPMRVQIELLLGQLLPPSIMVLVKFEKSLYAFALSTHVKLPFRSLFGLKRHDLDWHALWLAVVAGIKIANIASCPRCLAARILMGLIPRLC